MAVAAACPAQGSLVGTTSSIVLISVGSPSRSPSVGNGFASPGFVSSYSQPGNAFGGSSITSYT